MSSTTSCPDSLLAFDLDADLVDAFGTPLLFVGRSGSTDDLSVVIAAAASLVIASVEPWSMLAPTLDVAEKLLERRLSAFADRALPVFFGCRCSLTCSPRSVSIASRRWRELVCDSLAACSTFPS